MYGWLFLFCVLIIVIGICVGLSFLQVYLSKLSSKLWGLILPILWFLIFLPITIINLLKTYNVMFSLGSFIATLVIFLFCNIPTAIYIGIYIYCRRKNMKNSEWKRMQIQDLE